MPPINGAAPQPVAQVQLTLLADNNVVAQFGGQITEAAVEIMFGCGKRLLLKEIDKAKAAAGGIQVPPPDVQNRLLGR